jgi:hypothetical protein
MRFFFLSMILCCGFLACSDPAEGTKLQAKEGSADSLRAQIRLASARIDSLRTAGAKLRQTMDSLGFPANP